MSFTELRVNAERLLNDLQTLAQIGATPDGGVSRRALSEVDVLGRAWFKAQVELAGLTYKQDSAGNQSAVFPAHTPDAKTILFGSHLDTVPNGGQFDGALGTLAALETLRTFKEAGITPKHHLEAVSFTDEEGGVYSMLGSKALTGLLTMENLTSLPNQVDLNAGLMRLGLTKDGVLQAERDMATIKAFVEIHIEQGMRLKTMNTHIGVVTSIVGIRTFTLTFKGQAAHAGTMPMENRQDALWGAAQFVQAAKTVVMQRYTPGVMNCGKLTIPNSASNIVPAQVTMALEFRHGTTEQLEDMQATLLALAEKSAQENDLTLTIEPNYVIMPVATDHSLVEMGERVSESLGLSHTRLLSFAGHDTQSLAQVVPAVLFFIPSENGISHHPDEYSTPEDVMNGANVLLQMVAALLES